eukprot:TRINITY_DN86_c0_g3_i7.p1 TRINITY_DN86_c0_g3~~TRINITY_DN86_c0_g3_i7.p1  ORF type:complete len:1044 (+),score=497.31 TRINITY_DN86_c0_g3_i7:390-3134(+)
MLDPTDAGDEMSGRPDFGIMSFQFIGQRDATFFCLDEPSEREVMFNKLNQYVDATPEGLTTSVTLFRSTKTIMYGKSMIMTTATRSRFLNPSFDKKQDPDIWQVSSASFLRTKSKRTRSRYERMLTKAHGQLYPIAEVRDRDPGHVAMFVFPDQAPEHGLIELFNVLDLLNLRGTQLFAETFANGAVTYNLYLENLDTTRTPEQVQRTLTSLMRRMTTLAVLPRSARINKSNFGPRAKLYLGCAQVFTYHFMPHRSEDFHALREHLKQSNNDVSVDRLDRMGRMMQKDAVNTQRFNWTVEQYPELAWEVYDDFMRPRKPGAEAGDRLSENQDLVKRIKNTVTDPLDQEILLSCLLFNRTITKTNFFSREKAATSFRLDPTLFISEDYPEIPHAIFMVVGSTFEGFHIRFRDVSRGGIRMIKSPNQAYFKNQQSLFEENYNLAFTQQLKNKDIPEGGSKGTILLAPGHQDKGHVAFDQYIDGLLDLILPDPNMKSYLNQPEMLFFGPDEGTADKMDRAAQRAKQRGYSLWKASTTGKSISMGGIPHDTYGMTTRSVHQYVLGFYRKLELNESSIRKFQTGGPDGDLGSNEILISKDRTCTIVDGSGVLHDPEGLNREELHRLAVSRQMTCHFNPNLLGKGGFFVDVREVDRKLPDGSVVQSGLQFRNNFHLDPRAECDLFVPCGGRPESINGTNVNNVFDAKGTPRFKIVVEGANLFLTQAARHSLEDAGVNLVKDASANKGGVTSSSLEVLTALALGDSEYGDLMTAPAGTPPDSMPAFYRSYVAEVQARVEENARMEFECLWAEHKKTKVKMSILTDTVSHKINALNDSIQMSSLWEDFTFRSLVFSRYVPKTLLDHIGMDNLITRVPESYLQSIFGAYLAAQYIYTCGPNASEFEFFDFITKFKSGGGASKL